MSLFVSLFLLNDSGGLDFFSLKQSFLLVVFCCFFPFLNSDMADEEDDDYEEAHGGNRLLGFMFGNVDGSGDLDVDYLDEVALKFFLIPNPISALSLLL